MPLKNIIRESFLFKPVAARRESKMVREWIERGCSGPAPNIVKRHIIEHYRRLFDLDTLVETGTYLGDTVEFFRARCARIFSIELSEEYARNAQQRFRAFKHIEILQGDSGVLLGEVLKRLKRPALFWLDGHYSGGRTAKSARDTPIASELKSIFAHPLETHVILIDDARLFDGAGDYLSLAAFRDNLRQERPGYTMLVENDIIRCCPPMA